jgi:hypothetical protein
MTSLRRFAPLAALCLGLALGGAPPGLAQGGDGGVSEARAAGAQALADALGMDDLLPIMREEGLVYADELAADMFPGRTGGFWDAEVDRIYRVDRMEEAMVATLAAELDGAEIAALRDFFESDLGRRIVGLEVSARRALLDPAVEEASRAALERLRDEAPGRMALLRRFVEANDLVEQNVVGALNSNLAFYRGLADGEAFDGTLSEEDMLRDVWAQEPEIRSETVEWVYSYLGMAYRPLEDAALERYVALSETPEGVALNAALFAGFDRMFNRISRELGRAAARMMAGEDI